MTLPISAILPIFNCRDRLSRHLKSVERWADSVTEIIVVDSGSTDGSLELAKEKLTPFKATFFHHPPGLYQSWNAGIATAKAPWCYISTVEDPITKEGLEHLASVIVSLNADVTISPPEMRNHDGTEPVEQKMPSNRLAEAFKKGGLGDCLLNRAETITMLCGFLPHGLLGSSASNLYRTSLLLEHPFPTDFGHCGDTAWGITIAPFARVAFTPKSCARFYCQTNFKDETPEQQLTLHRQLANLAIQSLTSNSLSSPETAVMLGWFETTDHSIQVIRRWLADQFTYRQELESQLQELRSKYQGGILQYLRRSFCDEWKRITSSSDHF